MGVKLLGSKTGEEQFSVYTWNYFKIRYIFEVHIKNAKWHFFCSLLSACVQTPNTTITGF